MPYCAACGSLNEKEAKFCYYCGKQMNTAKPESDTPVPVQTTPGPPQMPATEPPPTGQSHTTGPFTAVGANGQIELSGNRIIVSLKGAMSFLNQGFSQEKETMVSQIASIELKNPSMLSRGSIQITRTEGNRARGRVPTALRDETTVIFDKRSQPEFEELKRRIDAVRNSATLPEEEPAQPSPAAWGLDELERLASFHQRGIITDAEFEAKKKEILGL